MKKKLATIITSILIMSLFTILPLYASQKKYSTSYDMYGGVFTSRSFSVSDYCNINVNPKTGTSGIKMGIYKAYKHWYGMSASSSVAQVSSTSSSSTTYVKTGTYYLYFRDWAGAHWTGDITIIWY